MNFLARIFRRRRLQSELGEEIQAHLQEKTDELVRSGMAPPEAARIARLEFGNPGLIEEDSREVWHWPALESVLADLRYALRGMRKNPGFTLVVILTLALGIGANVAIFTVVNTVLLQPLPYKDADKLFTVWGVNKPRGFDLDLVSYPDYLDWKAQNRVFAGMGASTDEMYTLTGAGEPDAVIAYEFSHDYFDVLGVPPLLGRTFAPDEDQAGKNHVAVLNYHLWASRFGADSGILGKSITLDGSPYTVIGVMPKSFAYPQNVEIWTPLTLDPQIVNRRDIRWLRVIARLKPGVTIEQAHSEMQTIAARLSSQYPETNKDQETRLMSLRQLTTGDVRPALVVLLCAVGFVLLIACANVANLMLSRAVARQREIAIRAALGATRRRMIRQFLTESISFSLVGGALGLLIAYWGADALVAMFPPTIENLSIPRIERLPIDSWVIGFAILASLVTGVLFGLAPAILATRMRIGESLKNAGRTAAGGAAQGRRLRNALVVVEVALSLMLLAGAGLMIQSFLRLLRSNPGFSTDHILTMRVLLPDQKYKTDAQELAFGQAAVSRVQSLPGVQSVGTVTFLPLSGWWGTREVTIAGKPADSAAKNPRPVWDAATPGYFAAMKIPLIEGRYFTEQDNSSNENVAILSASLARQLFPNDDPIGKVISIQGVDKPRRVAGVVGDVYQLGIGVRQTGVTEDVKTEVYMPFGQFPTHLLCFVIRTAGDPVSLARAAQQQIWAVDAGQAISFVEPIAQLASETVALQRASMVLLALFAGSALLLASIGIYGVISYSTSRRTNEIGIRIALGADSLHIVRLVIGEGLLLIIAGLVIGLAGSLALTRFLSSLLYEVRSNDPLTFFAVSVGLFCVGMAACIIPARRAMRVDLMIALHQE